MKAQKDASGLLLHILRLPSVDRTAIFGAFQMDCIPVEGPHTAGTSACSRNMVGMMASFPQIADVMVIPAEQEAYQELQYTPLTYWVF